jgi:Tat protein secretion system quality control protein TatD with DNase activity
MKNENWLDELEKMYTENDKVRAIGEIGLDYYWTPEEKEEQKVCFYEQMALAQRLPSAQSAARQTERHRGTSWVRMTAIAQHPFAARIAARS